VFSLALAGSSAYHLLEEVLIDFQEIQGEHSGINLAAAVWKTINLYNLHGKVFDLF
jgi:hypothetical protein